MARRASHNALALLFRGRALTDRAPARVAASRDERQLLFTPARHAIDFDDQQSRRCRRRHASLQMRSTARSEPPSMISMVAGTTRAAISA